MIEENNKLSQTMQ
jgi:hypothetical protein